MVDKPEQVVDTPIVEEVVDAPKAPKVEVEPVEEKSFTQIRAERAAEKARKEVLAELGVASIDEAKVKMQDGSKALEIATEIKTTIEVENQARINANKSSQLEELFKDTFDPKVLVQLTDLEAIELDESGKLVNPEEVLAKAKEERPRFFGQHVTKTDTVVTKTTQTVETDPITAAYQEGDYQKAVKEYLNIITK